MASLRTTTGIWYTEPLKENNNRHKWHSELQIFPQFSSRQFIFWVSSCSRWTLVCRGKSVTILRPIWSQDIIQFQPTNEIKADKNTLSRMSEPFVMKPLDFPVRNLLPGERASVGGLLQIQRRGGTLLSLWHCTFEFSVNSIHRGFCRCAICWGRQGIAVRLRGLPVTLSLSLPGEKEEKSGMNMSTRYLQHSPITICHSFISCYQGAFAIRSSDPTCGKASQRRPLHRPPPLPRFEKSSPITQVKENKLSRCSLEPVWQFLTLYIYLLV